VKREEEEKKRRDKYVNSKKTKREISYCKSNR